LLNGDISNGIKFNFKMLNAALTAADVITNPGWRVLMQLVPKTITKVHQLRHGSLVHPCVVKSSYSKKALMDKQSNSSTNELVGWATEFNYFADPHDWAYLALHGQNYRYKCDMGDFAAYTNGLQLTLKPSSTGYVCICAFVEGADGTPGMNISSNFELDTPYIEDMSMTAMAGFFPRTSSTGYIQVPTEHCGETMHIYFATNCTNVNKVYFKVWFEAASEPLIRRKMCRQDKIELSLGNKAKRQLSQFTTPNVSGESCWTWESAVFGSGMDWTFIRTNLLAGFRSNKMIISDVVAVTNGLRFSFTLSSKGYLYVIFCVTSVVDHLDVTAFFDQPRIVLSNVIDTAGSGDGCFACVFDCTTGTIGDPNPVVLFMTAADQLTVTGNVEVMMWYATETFVPLDAFKKCRKSLN
jgi:hypothetical protein